MNSTHVTLLWNLAVIASRRDGRPTLDVFANMVRDRALREAAKVAKAYEPRCDSCPSGVENAILHLQSPLWIDVDS